MFSRRCSPFCWSRRAARDAESRPAKNLFYTETRGRTHAILHVKQKWLEVDLLRLKDKRHKAWDLRDGLVDVDAELNEAVFVYEAYTVRMPVGRAFEIVDVDQNEDYVRIEVVYK